MKHARKTSAGSTEVNIETFGEILVSQGETESLTIEAPRDYLRYITSEVEDGTLYIKTRRGFVGGPVQRVIYTLTVKDLDATLILGRRRHQDLLAGNK